jgi:hypothetical protein
MTSQTQPELTAASIIPAIASGLYPRETLVTIAKGFLPLAQEDLIAVVAYLADNPDPELSAFARASLIEIPSRSVLGFAADGRVPAEHLRCLLRVSTDPAVLQALIRNRTVSDQDIAELALRAEPGVQEVIVINQIRILREPRILDQLLENPHVTPDVRRRALEVREEFFEKQARIQEQKAAEGPAVLPTPADDFEGVADLLERAVKEDEQGGPQPAPVDLDVSEKDRPIWAQLQFMTVSEKVQLAFKGDKGVRLALVREHNRLVASAAIRNPRMTETDVEQVAGMRNVDEEVLRIIGMKRDWTSKYAIATALTKNPKTPVGVVLPLINRLTLRDLKVLKDDKGVSEVVRSTAKRLFLARSQKQ